MAEAGEREAGLRGSQIPLESLFAMDKGIQGGFNPNRSLDFGEIARLCHAACFSLSRRRSGLRRGSGCGQRRARCPKASLSQSKTNSARLMTDLGLSRSRPQSYLRFTTAKVKGDRQSFCRQIKEDKTFITVVDFESGGVLFPPEGCTFASQRRDVRFFLFQCFRKLFGDCSGGLAILEGADFQ